MLHDATECTEKQRSTARCDAEDDKFHTPQGVWSSMWVN